MYLIKNECSISQFYVTKFYFEVFYSYVLIKIKVYLLAFVIYI